MAINSQLSKIVSKKQKSQQTGQKQNHRYGDHLECVQLGRERGRMKEKLQQLRTTKW